MRLLGSILASLATGAVVWTQLRENELYGALIAFGAVMALTSRPPKRKGVIVELGGLEWNEEEICENILVQGALGSGKTNAILNVMDQLFLNVPGWGGLFMDEKGEDHLGLLRLAKKHGREKDVIILEVASDGERVYPIQRMNLLTAAGDRVSSHILTEISYAGSSGGKNTGFFRHQTLMNLAQGMRFLRYKKQPVTMERLRDFLCSEIAMGRELSPMLPAIPKDGTPPAPVDPEDYRVAMYWMENYVAQAGDQKSGVVTSVANALYPFSAFSAPEVAEIFSSDLPDTVNFADVNKGKIICVLCPSTLPAEKSALSLFFKSLFLYAGAKRFDERRFGKDPENLLVAFLDEYQDCAATSDRKFMSKLRSARCCFLAAVQDTESLNPVVGEANAKVIIGKFRNRIIFSSESAESAQSSSRILGTQEVWKKSYSSGGKGSSTSRSQVDEAVIKPKYFDKLRNHRCVIIHANKEYRKNVRLHLV